MNRFKRMNYRVNEFVFTNVIDKTLGYILFTVIITVLLGAILIKREWFIDLKIAGALILFLTINRILSYEKPVKKGLALIREARVLEKRTPCIVILTRDQVLYIQNADLPVVFPNNGLKNYAVEFKVKVVVECFGFVFNYSDSCTGYMLQYNEKEKMIRPHFNVGLKDNVSWWKTPTQIANFLTEQTDVNFKRIDGYYNLRFEINQVEHSDESIVKKLLNKLPKKRSTIQHELETTTRYIHIKIYDMYDNALIKYEVIYPTPLYPYYEGGYFGFRQFGHESAMFRNIKLLKG
jgi:hypothetical protein